MQMVTIKVLTEIKGMSEAKVTKIREVAIKLVGFGFQTGTYMLEKRKHVVRITTGSENLDTLLGGGIESCSITGAAWVAEIGNACCAGDLFGMHSRFRL